MKTSRRDFVLRSMMAPLGVASVIDSLGQDTSPMETVKPITPGDYSVSVFSKHLHWLDYNGMADIAAEIGFNGVDITVRPEGHVLPERVAEDLPKAVEAVRKAGLNVYMITTAIRSAGDPLTESILKTAASLKIPYYRMGWFSYDDKKTMADNLKTFQVEMAKLAALNKKYQVTAEYQNHSGTGFGSPVWDLWTILKEIDPKSIGMQYDILHATVEGANAWPLGLKLLKSHIHTMDIKDFYWAKNGNQWTAQIVPFGEGMIDYKRFLGLVKAHNIRGPFSLHFEYDLGGAENGAKKITLKKEEVVAAMKRDLGKFKAVLAESGLAA